MMPDDREKKFMEALKNVAGRYDLRIRKGISSRGATTFYVECGFVGLMWCPRVTISRVLLDRGISLREATLMISQFMRVDGLPNEHI